MSEQGQEKTEEATFKRRTEARKKGTVAKSNDLVSALVLIAAMMAAPWAISSIGSGSIESLRYTRSGFPTSLSMATLGNHLMNVAKPVIPGSLGLIVIAMVVGVTANFAQVGFVISAEAMVPSFSKINPMSGLKRLLSSRSLFEVGKALFKSLVFGLMAYQVIMANWDRLNGLDRVSPVGGMSILGEIARAMALRIIMAWGALAAVDYFMQRKQVDKQLRMTKEEVKREMKEAESSPEVKMARAQRRRKMNRNRMMAAVKTADAIITNPTHFAIAVKYEHGKMHAPQVVAKGVDLMAARIREEAKKHEVPIVPNPPLARALYKQCEVGDFVPTEMFQAVAEVLAYVYRTLKRVRR